MHTAFLGTQLYISGLWAVALSSDYVSSLEEVANYAKEY